MSPCPATGQSLTKWNSTVPCVRKGIFVPLSLSGASMRQFASAPPSVVALTGHKNTHSSPAFYLCAFVSDCPSPRDASC